jgi:hypothetical protein
MQVEEKFPVSVLLPPPSTKTISTAKLPLMLWVATAAMVTVPEFEL